MMSKLEKWKRSPRRQPLLLEGARQVGKTWLLKEFAKTYGQSIYLNLDRDSQARTLFESAQSTDSLLQQISLHTRTKISSENTLLIFDEIQQCPAALRFLKFLAEDAPTYHVCAAGTLLNVVPTFGTGFPVGKVDRLRLLPLTFEEFLIAAGEELLAECLASEKPESFAPFHESITSLLKQYYVTGGMPGAVMAYLADKDLRDARSVQTTILSEYIADMSKHVRHGQVANILAVWDALPRFLSKENRRTFFGQIRPGARAKDFEAALIWLQSAGIVHRVRQVESPGWPLASYANQNIFKAFVLDVGLLGALSHLNPSVIINGNAVFTEFAGALTEQYVCQELVATLGQAPFYWSRADSRAELGFVVGWDSTIFGIEVKAEENLRAKSLRVFSERVENSDALRFSLAPWRKETWMRNIPLYAVANTTLWTL